MKPTKMPAKLPTVHADVKTVKVPVKGPYAKGK